MGLSAVYVALLVLLLTPNFDRLARIQAPRFWLEQIAALATAAAAAAAAFRSVVPGSERHAWALPIVPLAAWIVVVAIGSLQDWLRRGTAGLSLYSDTACLVAIAAGTVLPLAVMVPVLRRGAAMTPGLTLALAALAGGGLGSVAGCLSRASQHGSSLTVFTWHFGIVAGMAAVAAVCGPHVLQRRLPVMVARRGGE